MASKSAKPTPAHQALAAKIARALFMEGDGKSARPLVHLGGWAEKPLADRIARVLAGEEAK